MYDPEHFGTVYENQPDNWPTRKTNSATMTTAAATIVVYHVGGLLIDLPPEVADAYSVLIMGAAGLIGGGISYAVTWFVRDRAGDPIL